MKMINKSVLALAFLASGFHPEAGADTLVDVARADGGFSVFLEALEATGLDAVLQGAGPYTVFAPSDEAFAKLRPGTLDTLMRPGNREQLVEILKYHVVDGSLSSDDLSSRESEIVSLLGEPITVEAGNGILLNDEVSVVSADIRADNGIIHVIDSLIFPE